MTWPPPIPSKCPKCDEAVTVFEYGSMACCKAHGIVADNRPESCKQLSKRYNEDAASWNKRNPDNPMRLMPY